MSPLRLVHRAGPLRLPLLRAVAVGRVVSMWRERQLRRGRLPRVRTLNTLPRAREGVFRLGVRSGGGELAWDPWGIDPPHLLVTGTTGGGKSRLMETMALVALDWGWDVEIIDFKGGGDFWAATSHGARVVSTPKESTAALTAAADDIAARNSLMRQVPVARERADGRVVEDRATSLRDLPPEVRREHDLRPRLVLIDETASILDDKKGGGMAALRRAVQLGRSAGVHLVIGLQRPDADLLPGFIKHNVGARVLFGPSDKEAELMVLGSAVGGLDDVERTAPRPAGRALASGVGGRPIARFHAFLLERDTYLPFHRSEVLTGTDAPLDVGYPDGGTDSPQDTAPDSPDAPGAASPSPHGTPHAPVGGVPPGSGSSPRPHRVARLRVPWLVAPAVRVRLRLGALRCLVGPLRSGPFARDPDLAEAVKRSAGYRCAACGAGPPVQGDHRRPLWAGGRDAWGNLWCLCVKCHAAKTRVEAKVRAARKRTRSRSGRTWAIPRIPLWQMVGAACLVAGAVDGRWRLHALAVLAALGCWEWRGRGRGIDRISTLDARMEEQTYRGKFIGAVAGGRTRTVVGLATMRWGLMGMAAAYLAGYWLPRYLL